MAAVCLALAAAGAAAFTAAASGSQASRAWQAYLVNYVFWAGLAHGAVLLSAIATLTGARWPGPLKRLSEAFAAYLPLSWLLFWPLALGHGALFPSLGQAPPARQLWLAPGFLFPRDGVALLLLAGCGVWLAAASARASTALKPTGRAVMYSILYAVVLSLVGFDWIMSLDPHWTSTLFGAYYFVGSFYTGLAALTVVAGVRLALGRAAAEPSGAPRALEPEADRARSQDLGNLLLAFGLTTGYLFYVQFLVIWFANVPAETRFLVLRLRAAPWATLSWAVLALGFALPAVVLLFRRAKARPAVLAAVGALAAAGMWGERFLLVAPSLSRGPGLPLGILELLVTSGFGAVVCLSVSLFLRRFPPEGSSGGA